MGFSYILKMREFIFLLDLYGDVNSLEQKFSDVYISCDEHRKIASSLHEKGFAVVTGETVTPDSHIAFMMKKIYASELVLVHSSMGLWLYCSGDLVIAVSVSDFVPDEYIITPCVCREELMEIKDEYGGVFEIIRGGAGKVDAEKIIGFAEEYGYGQ